MNCEKARNISIVQALGKLGYFPQRETKKEAWFLSPFRSETQASFKVSKSKNKWYDFGIGKGGNTIDLIVRLKNYSVKETLLFLSASTNNSFSFQQHQNNDESKTSYSIKKVKSLDNPALLNYLEIRKINLIVAKKYCQEVYYKINNKSYFAIAFENDLGGFEIRNKYFKGGLKSKATTHLKNESNVLLVFEGFIDFLSLLTLNEEKFQKFDHLILNSLSFVDSKLKLLTNYKEIELYLDNDKAGKKASKKIQKKFNFSKDKSQSYSGYKDLNEFLKDKDKKVY